MINNELVKVFGKDFRTDICKVKLFKEYWLQAKVVELKNDILLVEVDTHYFPMIHMFKVNVNDVIKIKKI